MMATRPLTGSYGLPAGAWRWAALVFVVLAVLAAGVALGAPNAANWAGVALLAGIGAVACLFLYAVWPREGISAAEARRVAEAAARANVAWAVTGADGAVLDCNDVYRRMAETGEGEAPAPPELALAGESSAAVLYRLSRRAAEGRPGEESFRVGPGLELVAAVRPLPDSQAAWWFTPRLGASAQPAETRSRVRSAAAASAAGGHGQTPPPATLFRDAPVGLALADDSGRLVETNAAFDSFFGIGGSAIGRSLAELVEQADRAGRERPGRRRAGAGPGPRPRRPKCARSDPPTGWASSSSAPPMAAARR